MNKEYIERDAICEKCNNKESCFPYPEMRAKCPVYKAPAEDVAPIIHGEWLVNEYEQHTAPLTGGHGSYCYLQPISYRCSLCGRVEEYQEPHCNCGARMDGDNK